MTINKSQGQTFQRVGVYLPRPCFSHGQMYVACSRVGDPDAVTIMVVPPPGTKPEDMDAARSRTPNVVFKEVWE